MLEIEPGYSGRAASVHNCWAIFPAPCLWDFCFLYTFCLFIFLRQVVSVAQAVLELTVDQTGLELTGVSASAFRSAGVKGVPTTACSACFYSFINIRKHREHLGVFLSLPVYPCPPFWDRVSPSSLWLAWNSLYRPQTLKVHLPLPPSCASPHPVSALFLQQELSLCGYAWLLHGC